MPKISELPVETSVSSTDFIVMNALVGGIETTITISAANFISALNISTGGGGGGGAIVSVKQAQLTSVFTTTSTSFTTVTGLSITYTPTSASNKILLILSAQGCGTSGTSSIMGRLIRGSTPIGIGDAAGSRIRATLASYVPDVSSYQALNATWLDSPATTSSTTWAFQIQTQGAGTAYINQNSSDANSSAVARTVSTLTLMEVTP